MSTSETTELVGRMVGGRQLPDEVMRQIFLKADGIPLFVEELTRTVVESNILQPTDDAYILTRTLPAFAVPATLHDSLMARLDRLSGTREVAQLAAAIGRSTEYSLLSAAADCDEAALGRALAQLEEAGLLLRRGSSYRFKHALIQEAAYRSMVRTTRQHYHRRIAAAIEQQSSSPGKSDAAVLAHHYAEGGMIEPAIRCFRRAGEAAVEASAFAEAIDNFTRALALLERLAESPEQAREEITIRLALGAAQLPSLRGSPELERSYRRVLTLCERFGAPKDRFAALWGLWYCNFKQGKIYRSRHFGDQLLPQARELGDPSLFLEAYHVLWSTMATMGDLPKALAHTEEGLSRYDRKEQHRLTFVYGGHDPGACACYVNAVMLCVLGYPEQAQRRSQAAVTLAQELGHPNTLALSYFFALLVAFLMRDIAKVQQFASDLDELVRSGSAPQGYLADAESFRGWILAERGSIEQGLDLIRRSHKSWQGWDAWSYPQGAFMATTLAKAGLAGEGLQLIGEGLHAAARGGAHWYDAELYRIRADLRRAMNADGWIGAERDLKKSIQTARTQQARYFELRAATDLARLWAERGHRQKAHDLLAPILGWFTEGLDTPYVVAARACLSSLAA